MIYDFLTVIVLESHHTWQRLCFFKKRDWRQGMSFKQTCEALGLD